jgi:hypothetical protein
VSDDSLFPHLISGKLRLLAPETDVASVLAEVAR